MRYFNLFTLFFLCALQIGCSIISKPTVQDETKTYLLELKTTHAKTLSSPAKPNGQVLMVMPMRAMPGFETDAMIYTTEQLDHKTFALHRWIAPPAQMLTAIISKELQHSGIFKAVIENDTLSKADVLLFSELLCLRQVFDDTTQTQNSPKSHMELGIKVTFVDERTGDVINQQNFFVSKEAQEPNPHAGAKAAINAAEEFTTALLSFLNLFLDVNVRR